MYTIKKHSSDVFMISGIQMGTCKYMYVCEEAVDQICSISFHMDELKFVLEVFSRFVRSLVFLFQIGKFSKVSLTAIHFD